MGWGRGGAPISRIGAEYRSQPFSRSREKVPGGRMRGASAAKRAFDLRCLDVRVEAKGNSLRSLPSSGALRHLLPQAGEGLGWPGGSEGSRVGKGGVSACRFGWGTDN